MQNAASDQGIIYIANHRMQMIDIMHTGRPNFDPLKPNFYIVKLRFTGVYMIFLISAKT